MRLVCTSPQAPSGAGWTQLTDAASPPYHLLWQLRPSPRPQDRAAWLNLLAGRPPLQLSSLRDRYAHCRDQKNCRQGPVPTTEELRQQCAEAQVRAALEPVQPPRERPGRGFNWFSLAGLLVLFLVYAAVAHAAGRWLANGALALLGMAGGIWAFSQARSEDGWGGLALLIIAPALFFGGFLLAAAYDWLFHQLFRRHKAR